jgi:beta-lactam-binding protein with PASTA domain
MRYGGEGDCRTVPSVIGASRTTAANRIIAAGLVTGTIGTVVDPLCEDLNTVLTQSPAPGTRLGAGSPVSFKYGVAPTRGCPIDPK